MISRVRKKLVFITFAYWFLLLYIIAALLFWFIELNKHVKNTAVEQIALLDKTSSTYQQKLHKIEDTLSRKKTQFIGEGITFFAVIMVGAVFVYRATKKQIKLSTQQQNFMMAITHELKTPIAITKLNLETLQKRKLAEEKQHKLISNTLHEANRLNSLCNNILLTAQLEGGVYDSTKQEINFSELIEDCIEDFATRFPQRKTEADIQQQIHINGEPLLLQILVNNLIENALKYSPKDSFIKIKLIQQNYYITLSVADKGFGISNTERKKVFQKFYRSGNEITRTTKGTGLGLYLCSKIMESHNGNISMTNNTPQGSIFVATFKV
ncbi:MAG: two-component sensor histidine kinase [Chitinophagaceae bacterium]|nr:two-component sensor histidine kinase [Chitinophagaceae bacterium]MCW5904128.1 two-component sensor histidine kinase [Chitinophagaceae bacterium]